MTLEAWVRPTHPRELEHSHVQGAPRLLRVCALREHGVEPAVRRTSTTPTTVTFAAPHSCAASTWTHLAATYDGNVLALYVNGVQNATLLTSGPIVTSTGSLRIGENTIWGEAFTGQIDEVRIYNRALAAAEIQSDMTRPDHEYRLDASDRTDELRTNRRLGDDDRDLVDGLDRQRRRRRVPALSRRRVGGHIDDNELHLHRPDVRHELEPRGRGT